MHCVYCNHHKIRGGRCEEQTNRQMRRKNIPFGGGGIDRSVGLVGWLVGWWDEEESEGKRIFFFVGEWEGNPKPYYRISGGATPQLW